MIEQVLPITLHPSELLLSHHVAAERIAMNEHNGAGPRYGGDGHEMKHIVAARCEIAVAKALNLHWSGCRCGDYHSADVGGCVEVRGFDVPGRRLILHPDDNDHLPFVLADASRRTTVLLMGWMMGGEGKRPQWWQDPTGQGRWAFFVDGPLNPMSNLVKHFHRDPL